MGYTVSRRKFLGAAMASVVTADAAVNTERQTVPTRVLGRTGVRTPILGIGGGMTFWRTYEERGLEALNLALDLGIAYFDTGQIEVFAELPRRTRLHQDLAVSRNWRWILYL